MFQLSHPYMTTGKTIALTIWIFVSKVMSLLLNVLFSGKEPACQCRICDGSRFDPCVGKILEEGMATHFSILAWRIPWTEESGRLQATGSQRVGHD